MNVKNVWNWIQTPINFVLHIFTFVPANNTKCLGLTKSQKYCFFDDTISEFIIKQFLRRFAFKLLISSKHL